MQRLRTRAAIVRAVFAACLSVSLVPALAARTNAIEYHGKPDLPLTVSMVVAGGGPAHFSSAKLFAFLTGPLEAKEAAKLTNQFGAADVKKSFAIFDYAVDDTLKIVTAKGIALPKPAPSPEDPKALAVALYGAGVTSDGKWDVGYFLEHLITHPVHHAIMHDMDAHFGAENNGTFHMVLDQMMHDVGVAYGPALR